MSRPARHIIRKQVIDLSVDKRLDAFEVQQRLSTFYYDEVLPLLESVFNNISSGDEIISIDELYLDLGSFTESELSRRFYIEQLLATIAEQIYNSINQKADQMGSSVARVRPSLSVFQQWLYYMQRGYLPWNADEPDHAWYQKILEVGATDHASFEALRKLILEDNNATERIVLQHQPFYLVHLIELLTAKNQQQLSSVVEELVKAIIFSTKQEKTKIIPAPTSVRHSIWKSILILAVKGIHEMDLSTMAFAERLIMENFSAHSLIRLVSSPTFLEQAQTTKIAWEKVADQIKNETASQATDKEAKRGKQGECDTPEDKKFIKPLETIITPGRIKSIAELTIPEEPQAISIKATPPIGEKNVHLEIDGDGIFISHAGLVLLHPFLPVFLKYMKLAEDGKFSNIESQQKAVLLLNHLATGNTEPEEHELVIAKLLCGFPLHDTLDTHINLDNEQLEGAEELLKDVVEQWEIMKGTSPAGLREAFLQRRGKLSFANDAHLLQVETTTIDILLDQLPWTLNYIKLPWMENMLRVEWR